MGQQEVLQEIEKNGFITLSELKNILSLNERAITNSLMQLRKWSEIESTNLGIRYIYFSLDFLKLFE